MHFKFYIPLLLIMVLGFSSFYNHSHHLNVAPNKDGDFLEPGEKVPNFVTKDVLGNKVVLKKRLKNSNVLLTFLRPAWCPVCNARTHELIENYEALKAQGLEVIAVYPSTAEKLKGYVNDLNIPFTVIADPEEELYRLYKIERSKEKYAQTVKEAKGMEAFKKGQALFKKHGNDYGGSQQVEEPIIPADFILEKDKIKEAHYGAFLGDHLVIENLQNDKKNTSKARF